MTPDQSIASPNAAPPPPRITSVTYRHLKTHRGRYENSAVEAAAEVPAGADPAEILHDLQCWVRSQLADNEARSEAFEKLDQLHERVRVKEELLAELERKQDRILDAISENQTLMKALLREGQSGAALLLAAAEGKPWLVEDLQHEMAADAAHEARRTVAAPVNDEEVPF